MCEITFYQKYRDIILNRGKEYYKNIPARIRILAGTGKK